MSKILGVEISCDHICHERGLNPWVETCPVCGCENPKYDPDRKSDIKPSWQPNSLSEIMGILGWGWTRKEHED